MPLQMQVPASFKVPRRAEAESVVIMPDMGAASWGCLMWRPYTEHELDDLGISSMIQVLDMLEKKRNKWNLQVCG